MCFLAACSSEEFSDNFQSEISNHEKENVVGLLSFENLFMGKSLNNISIDKSLDEIKKSYDLKFEINSDVWKCNGIDKHDKKLHSYGRCKYLGKWKEKNIVFSRMGSNFFTLKNSGILLYSIKDGHFIIHDSIGCGCGNSDCIERDPIFDCCGMVYFRKYMNEDELKKYFDLEKCGLKNYLCDCIYNLNTKKLEVISIIPMGS